MNQQCYAYYRSLLGWLEIGASEGKIASIRFVRSPRNSDDERCLRVCIRQLAEYFKGRRRSFTVPLSLKGSTPFRMKAWNAMKKVKYGTQCTYGELADATGRKRAARAIGTAVGANPVCIILPCHRIVPGSFQGNTAGCGGYAWGTKKKAWLLEHEKRHP